MTVHNSMGVVGKDPSTGAAVPLVTPANVRANLAALVRTRTNSNQPKTGRLKGGRFADLTVFAGSGWTYAVEPGVLIVGASPTRGADIVVSDSVVTLGTDPAPSSGSRYDVVFAVQKDAFDSSNDATAALIDVAKGVVATSGTPTLPDLPPNAVTLATNLMQSTATSTGSTGNTITNVLGFTSLASGIGLYSTLSEMQGDDSRDRGMLGFLTADTHLYLKTNFGTGAGAAEVALATWADLPQVRSRTLYSNHDGGATKGPGNITYLTASVTVPAGRVGVARMRFRTMTYLASGSYAGNLYCTVDGTDIQTTRYHNQGRTGMQTYDTEEMGFNLQPGTHTLQLRMGTDSVSATHEVWFTRGEIVVEW